MVNLEAVFFGQEVSETQQRTNAAPRAGTLCEECEVADECEGDKSGIVFDRPWLRQAECREHFCQLLARAS